MRKFNVPASVGIAALCLATGAAMAAPCDGPAETSEITVMGDWLPWASQGPMVEAQLKGYYEAEGLTVDLQAPAAIADPIKLVARDRVQFALTYVPDILQARDTGIPVISVATTLRPFAQGIMVPSDIGIDSLADLKGRTVGIVGSQAAQAGFATLLDSVGLTADDVTIVDPGYGVIQLLVAGTVDAGHGLIYAEPVAADEALKGLGRPPVNFYLYSEHGVPAYYYQLLAANEDWVKANPNTTCRFLRATMKGYEDFAADPEPANAFFAANNEVYTLDQHRDLTSRTIPDWKGANGEMFVQDEAVWKEAEAWALARGLIELGAEPSSYFTNDYLPPK